MFVATAAARRHTQRELALKKAIHRQTTAVAATGAVAPVPSRKSTWILCQNPTPTKPPPLQPQAMRNADLEP